jgi:hypothetical protein
MPITQLSMACVVPRYDRTWPRGDGVGRSVAAKLVPAFEAVAGTLRRLHLRLREQRECHSEVCHRVPRRY